MTENPEKFSNFSKKQKNESLKKIADDSIQKVVGMVSILVNSITVIACLVLIAWFILNG